MSVLYIYIFIYIYMKWNHPCLLPWWWWWGSVHEVLLGVRVLSRMLWKLEDVKKFIMKSCKHIQK